MANPYRIVRRHDGLLVPSEYDDVMPVEGEDPRLLYGVRLPSHLGSHIGWCESTVVTEPDLNHSERVKSITQGFYWGETLGKMEKVAELKDFKNTYEVIISYYYDAASAPIKTTYTPSAPYAHSFE